VASGIADIDSGPVKSEGGSKLSKVRAGWIAAGVALAPGAVGCGGGDDDSGTGGGDVAAAVESCAMDAGLDTATLDVNSLEAKDVDAGVTEIVRAVSPDAGVASEVRVFGSPEEAEAWASQQKTFGGSVSYEVAGRTVTEVLSGDSSGEDLVACAADNG
jgi:hypothetical protein